MADPRTLRWLVRIDARLESIEKKRDRALAEIDEELEGHDQRLRAHDRQLAQHDRVIRWLCRKVERRARK